MDRWPSYNHSPMDQVLKKLRDAISSVYMGNDRAVDRLLTCLLARGHALVEDVPGVGKTVLANAMARSIAADFSRIQCTPDLLPTDITGTAVLDRRDGAFTFRPGPVFANIVLADEINRTTPRTQSALLEAMSESQVSAEGETHRLPDPFLVVATQNPYEFEGTYPLPENQLDRFLMRIGLGYPSPDDEARILEVQPARTTLQSLEPAATVQEILELQRTTDRVVIDASLADYVIALAQATRDDDDLVVGMSPRGSLALAQAARATAVLDGRDHCIPEDIVENVIPVCAHRVVTKISMHEGDTVTARRIMQRILETVASPV